MSHFWAFRQVVFADQKNQICWMCSKTHHWPAGPGSWRPCPGPLKPLGDCKLSLKKCQFPWRPSGFFFYFFGPSYSVLLSHSYPVVAHSLYFKENNASLVRVQSLLSTDKSCVDGLDFCGAVSVDLSSFSVPKMNGYLYEIPKNERLSLWNSSGSYNYDIDGRV